MDVYRTEEEQVAALRGWVKKNGVAVLIAVLLAVATYAAWNWYRHTKLEQSLTASSLYQSMMQSYQTVVAGGEGAADAEARLTKGGEQLIAEHDSSPYAQFAALMLAGRAVEQDDYPAAEKYLRAALVVDRDEKLVVLITHRLARVLSAQGKHDEALALLSADVPETMRSAREDVRGDILLAQGKRDLARAAWQQAIDALAKDIPKEDPARRLLEMKLDYVAGE